uniref:SCP domain-containing protein n=1 Tax=Mesocestoides corti TaxID=53468 RepID=A0A5K3FC84_MESCO
MRRVIYLVALIWGAVADIPTEDQRTQVVEFLTNLRESVDPPASNMLLTRYSSALETAAEKSLANCSSNGLERNCIPQDVHHFGIHSSQKGPAYFDMLNLHASVGHDYNYDHNKCTRSCLYYKMMILATSNAVGCAQKECTGQGDTSESYLTICLLKKKGGNADERPYKRGKSCSECPDGFICHRKQCLDQPPPVTHSHSPTNSISTILSPVSIINMLIFGLCFVA